MARPRAGKRKVAATKEPVAAPDQWDNDSDDSDAGLEYDEMEAAMQEGEGSAVSVLGPRCLAGWLRAHAAPRRRAPLHARAAQPLSTARHALMP